MDFEDEIKKNDNWKKRILNIFLIIGFLVLFIYYFLSAPFGNKDVIIHVASSQSVNSVLQELMDKRAIRNDLTLKIFIKIFKKSGGIIAGDYLIEKKSAVWTVAWQLSRGKHNILPMKITIREGLTNEEIATLLADKLAGFRKDLFLSAVLEKQGYLFPDTYFFYPLDTTDEIVDKFLNNFNQRIKNLGINTNSKSLNEIIIMASILEGEASGVDDGPIISGILWKRINLGMPLQVDVDKTTYTQKGLPLWPINNPGLISINSAMRPINSSYLYYLHDKNGIVHYAVSFEEHRRNINKYLK